MKQIAFSNPLSFKNAIQQAYYVGKDKNMYENYQKELRNYKTIYTELAISTYKKILQM